MQDETQWALYKKFAEVEPVEVIRMTPEKVRHYRAGYSRITEEIAYKTSFICVDSTEPWTGSKEKAFILADQINDAKRRLKEAQNRATEAYKDEFAAIMAGEK